VQGAFVMTYRREHWPNPHAVGGAGTLVPVPQLVRMKKMLLRLASALELPANPLDQARTVIK